MRNAIVLTAEEKRKRLELSAKESERLTLRDIRCPYCNFILTRVFSDAGGHYLAKCQKCKRQIVLNLAYFRRQKGIGKRKAGRSAK